MLQGLVNIGVPGEFDPPNLHDLDGVLEGWGTVFTRSTRPNRPALLVATGSWVSPLEAVPADEERDVELFGRPARGAARRDQRHLDRRGDAEGERPNGLQV